MKRSLGAKPLACPTPAWLVGTYDRGGKPNIMTVAWCGICCSQPPCMTVSLRKATYTYDAVMLRKAYTINIPSEEQVAQTDHAGIVSGRTYDKFGSAGLTPVRSELVDAPYVAEFPLVLECKVIHTLEIGLHTQFIGEIVDVKADESVLDEAGTPDIMKIRPFVYSPGAMTYHALGELLGKAFSLGKGLP